MSKRKSTKALVVDAILLVFWLVILIELLLAQDIIWAIVAFICVFIFAALLGRDVRRRGAQ